MSHPQQGDGAARPTLPPPPQYAAAATAPPPADVAKLFDDALKAFQDEYKDRTDSWRSIEGKAQSVLTTGGAFLGGVFALVQRLDRALPALDVALVVVAVLTLSAAVVHALLALRLRKVADPPSGAVWLDESTAITRAGPPSAAVVVSMKRDIAGLWRACVESVGAANAAKARLVRRGQLLIGLGALSVSALTLALVLPRWL